MAKLTFWIVAFNFMIVASFLAKSAANDGRDVEAALEKLINDTVAERMGQYEKEIDEKILRIEDLSKMVDELKTESKQCQDLVYSLSGDVKVVKVELDETKRYQDQVNNLSGELKTVKVRLDATNKSTNQIANRLIGVENTFTTSFTVDGSTHYYYPVAIAVHSQYLTRSPLEYEIHRSYFEKAPDILRPVDNNNHPVGNFPGLTLKFLVTEGGSTAGGNTIKVLYHQWQFNKTVGKIELGVMQDLRVIVWLRGGGILYNIKSPVDLTGKYRCDQKVVVDQIKVYYEDNELECGNYDLDNWPPLHISPLPFGQEDGNLVKKGQYDGWAF